MLLKKPSVVGSPDRLGGRIRLSNASANDQHMLHSVKEEEQTPGVKQKKDPSDEKFSLFKKMHEEKKKAEPRPSNLGNLLFPGRGNRAGLNNSMISPGRKKMGTIVVQNPSLLFVIQCKLDISKELRLLGAHEAIRKQFGHTLRGL